MTPIPAGWKPIESAPKDGTPVLLFARHIDAEASTRVVGWFNADYGWIAQSYIGQPFARLIPSQWAELLPLPGSPASVAPGDAQDERQADACPRCLGSGEVTILSDNSPDAHDVDMPCDHCHGTGAAVDAATYLAAALSGEKFRHMQLYSEYKNFHRSLCARFGYGHDEVHFRRDLVSLEEAIAAKVAAPAAGDALDAARYRWLRDPQTDVALVLAKRTGYVPADESIPGIGGYYTYEYRAGEELDAAIDDALAAQVPHQDKGDA